jgi:hypothetical protein
MKSKYKKSVTFANNFSDSLMMVQKFSYNVHIKRLKIKNLIMQYLLTELV